MGTVKEFFQRLLKAIRRRLRKIYNKRIAKRLHNRDFSLIASNCTGGWLQHDLGVKFHTPFINLWLKPDEFVRLLSNIDHYLNCELKFIEEPDISYPIGLLDDVRIYFQHYQTEQSAKEQWEARAKRINFDNLFIIFTDRNDCTYQNLCDFDALPYKNKVVFTHVPYPELQSAYYLKGWEKEECVGHVFDYKSLFSIKKNYDAFDYISWFNNGK